jgi:hypothetical protein
MFEVFNMSKKAIRLITIDGNKWKYVVGRCFVKIWPPNGKSKIVWCHTVKGVDPYVYERGQWKQTSDGMITPKDIENYIRKNWG